ncbi:MAG: glycoside hydrolase family 3 C-terminal domain-containing protein [Micrococcaceae bacterium]
MMKNKKIVEKMTLEEKASLTSGLNFWNTKPVERLGIPKIMMADGPHGLRKQAGKEDHLGVNGSFPATCFPTAATLANSWDKKLAHDVGKAIGQEAKAEKVSILLGPGINIKRNPLGGRSFEYFSEDPHLTGELASEMVKGIQSNGVSACPKHYAVNSQETMRITIDEIVDERSLREIYLAAFEKVVKSAKPKMMMTSYNKVNGEYSNDNPHLNNEILRKEWGYEGVTTTDWAGNNDRVKGLKAENSLEMPTSHGLSDAQVVAAVKDGTLDESVLDNAVDKLLTLIAETKPEDQDIPDADLAGHHENAITAAEQAIVMLKNKNRTLPLKDREKVAIIGDFAQTPRFQGAGSSRVNAYKISTPLEAIEDSNLDVIGYAQGFKRSDKRDSKLKTEALELAQKADTLLVFIGLDETKESEGFDRDDLSLAKNQLELVLELSSLGKKIVVVLVGGSAVEMPFVNQVDAILHTYLAGQGVGAAVANILTGTANPCGKLSETFPLKKSDLSNDDYYPGREQTAEHREAIFVGYRYFDTANVPVQFPFGFGLSFTIFEYSNLQANHDGLTFTVTNTGEVAGAEVAQLYVAKKDSKIFRAAKELRGFEKVYLEPGECKEISLQLNNRDFAHYSIDKKDWVIEDGEYEILVGSSSADIKLKEIIKVTGDANVEEYSFDKYPNYAKAKVKHVPDSEFYKLLGYVPPSPYWDSKAKLDMNSTVLEAKKHHLLGKATYGFMRVIKKSIEIAPKKEDASISAGLLLESFMGRPLGSLVHFSGGKLNKKMVQKYLDLMNRS